MDASPIPPDAGPDAALGRRVAAGLIDVVILTVAFVLIGIAMGETTRGPGSFYVELGGAGTLVFMAVTFLYYFLFESGVGRTPGKAMLGLRVVDTQGGPAGAKAVGLRTLLRIIDWLPFFYVVGFVAVLSTGRRRQRLGDLAGKTMVVRMR